jgi:large subunit ribosomal protein L18
MSRLEQVSYNHNLRKSRVRSTVKGTAERPRLSIYVSNRHVSAQLIDDEAGRTLASITTASHKDAQGTMSELCEWTGTEIAKKAVKIKVKKVVLDRNGRRYEKRLKALADAARNNGLEF